ncbi:EAL domain-containing protein [Aliikangiella sp. IMCC44632]
MSFLFNALESKAAEQAVPLHIKITSSNPSLSLDMPLPTLKELKAKPYTPEQAIERQDYTLEYYSESLLAGSDTYWQKLELTHQAANSGALKLYLVFDNPIITHLDVYLYQQKQHQPKRLVAESALGVADLNSSRFVTERYARKLGQILEFELQPFETATFLLRKNSHSPAILPIKVLGEKAFVDYIQLKLMFWGAVIAVLAAIALYNVAIYLMVRNAAYLWYLAFYGLSFIYFAGLHGFGVLLWPDAVQNWLGQHILTLNFILLLVAINFACRFLQAKQFAPKLMPYLPWWTGTLGSGALLSLWVAEYYLIPVFSLMQLAGTVYTFSLAIIVLRAGFYPARFFILSWSFVLIGAAIGTMAYISVLPANFFTMHAFFFGTVLELLLLSIALADRIRYTENLAMTRAYIDPRTNLPNFSYFKGDRYQLDLAAPTEQASYCLLLLQLDGIKDILALFGPEKLDIVRAAHIQRITQYLLNVDWAVQFILPDKSRNCLISLPSNHLVIIARVQGDLTHITTPLLALADTLVKVEGLDTKLNFRLGVVDYDIKTHDPQESYRRAQQALIECENQGVDWLRYSPEMDKKTGDQLALLADLRIAIEALALEIYIQPQFDIQTKTLLGGETLIRWFHPTRGMVSPGEFIELAERSNLISQITQFVIHESFEWLNQYAPQKTNFHLSINLSVLDIQDSGLTRFIKTQLEYYQISPKQVVFEITESAVMRNQAQFLKVIAELHEMGFEVALDDFGTGYSSMQYLQYIKANMIKIDMSFVRDIHLLEINQKIVKAIIQMADSTQAITVAEGIEVEQELLTLQGLGATLVQGFMTGKPIAASEFAKKYHFN